MLMPPYGRLRRAGLYQAHGRAHQPFTSVHGVAWGVTGSVWGGLS
jgi:hypothetical protein